MNDSSVKFSMVLNKTHRKKKKKNKKAVVFLFSQNCDFFFPTSECYDVPAREANAVPIYEVV